MITLVAALVIAPYGTTFICSPIMVWDGDGPVKCAEGPKLRLRGVAAREHDETCRSNQPCPKASARVARDTLVELLGGSRGMTSDGHVRVEGARLSCLSFGPDHFGKRTVAACRLSDGRDLSCALVQRGVVLPWREYGGDAICRDQRR